MEDLEFRFDRNDSTKREHSGTVEWQSPSNLAIVKYWGKHGIQLPRNPSISITLSEAITKTRIEYQVEKKRKELHLDFTFEDQAKPAFEARIYKFLKMVETYFPFLANSNLSIHSENSFPHSSGIASSASSMSALALCLCSIQKELGIEKMNKRDIFLKKASFISRLGSGSACRSVYPYFGMWGELNGQNSSDLYAVPIKNYHQDFQELRNDILIVSAAEKSVSSTAGHKLMEENVYASTRFDQAFTRTERLMSILSNGEIQDFGEMLESEALTLHALMMASNPSYLLMAPNTINVINEIREFRRKNNIPIYFSLDAGPNVHIISFQKDRSKVVVLLEELKKYAVNGRILNDRIGEGPKQIK